MIDGTYIIEMDTPLGHKSGKVDLRTEESAVFVSFQAPIIGKQRVEGRLAGDSFTIEGSFKSLLTGKVPYTLRGTVTGDDLRIHIDSSKGSFDVTGKRA